LFAEVKPTSPLNKHINFKSFFPALTLLLRFTCGENW